MIFSQIHRRGFLGGSPPPEKNLEVSAKNVKSLLYLEFKCLGDSCVGEEFEVESERFFKKSMYSKGARPRN